VLNGLHVPPVPCNSYIMGNNKLDLLLLLLLLLMLLLPLQ
jgi:hypothetical protein